MAIDNNGKVYEYRTLQFYGYAYGNSNVSLTANINGNTVFSGEVATINTEIPPPQNDITNAPLLFSVNDSTLLPTNWAGTYPMSITVNGGYGVVFGNINCNYMNSGTASPQTIMENSSISGNVLSVGTVSSGTVAIGQVLQGTDVIANTHIVSGSDTTWIVNNIQTVPTTTITGYLITINPGVADEYQLCYNGKPVNSENTPDPRSSVTIDGITQVPPLPASKSLWSWVIPSGSTISYNLNISLGNCAQT